MMNSKQFLALGGIILVFLAVMGFIGVLGPSPAQSLLKETWWFNNLESWSHLVLGILMLIFAMALSYSAQRLISFVIGVIFVLLGIYGFFGTGEFISLHLEYPTDLVFHLIFGFWAILSARKKELLEI